MSGQSEKPPCPGEKPLCPPSKLLMLIKRCLSRAGGGGGKMADRVTGREFGRHVLDGRGAIHRCKVPHSAYTACEDSASRHAPTHDFPPSAACLNLPPAIPRSEDGEEGYAASCLRLLEAPRDEAGHFYPAPNRTLQQTHSPPPYRPRAPHRRDPRRVPLGPPPAYTDRPVGTRRGDKGIASV